MVPAERVARDLGLSRKTVQAHFHRLREAIAEESRQTPAQIGDEGELDESYFSGVRKGERPGGRPMRSRSSDCSNAAARSE